MESSQDMYVFLIINSFSTQNFAVQLHAMFTQSATSVNSTRWSQSTGCVDLPRVKTSVGQHSFAFHGPTLGNSLPSAQLRLPRTHSAEQSAVSAASPSTDPHCGTVCHQHCMTAACHSTRLSGDWRPICLDSHECHPGRCGVSLWFWRRI